MGIRDSFRQKGEPCGSEYSTSTPAVFERLEARLLLSTTVFSESFGGSHPGAWSIGHDGGGGTYAWAWPNDNAHCYANPSGGIHYYPDNLHVYMERRGVSLAAYDTADLSFKYIVDTEPGSDFFTVNVRDQWGIWHELWRRSGITDPLTWSSKTLSLDSFAGQSSLYVQFRFDSDGSGSGSPYAGVYIDDISLVADVHNDPPNRPTFQGVPSARKLYPYPYSSSPDDTNGPYYVTVDYTDPDGRGDLQHTYLQIKGTGTPQTIMYYNMSNPQQWSGEGAHLYNIGASKTSITNGYRVTYSFQIKGSWTPSTNVDFEAWAIDDSNEEGSHRAYDWNGIYDNNLRIYDARLTNLVDTDGDGYYSSVRVEADADTSVSSRSVMQILYMRNSAAGGGGWYVWDTGTYTTHGSNDDWRGATVTVNSTGAYDFAWELYDPAWYITNRWYDVDADVSNILMEPANRAPDPPSLSSVPSARKLYPYTYPDSPDDTNGPYTVVVDYTDPDGRGDLKHTYLQLRCTGGTAGQQTIMYSDMTSAHQRAGEGDHLRSITANKTAIPNGYRVTYAFQLDASWTPSTNVDFEAWAIDDSNEEGSHRAYDWNGIYDNALRIYDARLTNLVDKDGDGYYSSVRVEADADTSVSSRSVMQILYMRNSAAGGGGWYVWDTGRYTTYGSNDDWTGATVTVNSTGAYDFGWELYDPDWYIANRWYDVDADISNILMEPASEDIANRTIDFAGMTWNVKTGYGGPGPNRWSNNTDSVWVDASGCLHLAITERSGQWYCSEVYTQESFGYGRYIFHVSTNVEDLDRNTVAGLFTYLDQENEIDIEFSRWGAATNPAGQYVVQPWDGPGNLERFHLGLTGTHSTHLFDWQEDRVFFQSYHGQYPSLASGDYLIHEWTYTGPGIPPAGDEKLHLNFWLMNGLPPSDSQPAELIIKAVEVLPPMMKGDCVWYENRSDQDNLPPDLAPRLARHGMDGVFVRQGQFHAAGDFTDFGLTQSDYEALAGFDVQITYGFDSAFVHDYLLHPMACASEVVAGIQASLPAAGFSGIQLNMEGVTPTEYAVLLEAMQAAFPQKLIGTTVQWDGQHEQADYVAMLGQVDYVVPMLYDRLTPGDFEVVDPSWIGQAVEALEADGKPFYAGIPSFGYVKIYDGSGGLLVDWADAITLEDLTSCESVTLEDTYLNTNSVTGDPLDYSGDNVYVFRANETTHLRTWDIPENGYIRVVDVTPRAVQRYVDAAYVEAGVACQGVAVYHFRSTEEDEFGVAFGGAAYPHANAAASVSPPAADPGSMTYTFSLANSGNERSFVNYASAGLSIDIRNASVSGTLIQKGDFDEVQYWRVSGADVIRVADVAEADFVELMEGFLDEGEAVTSGPIVFGRTTRDYDVRYRGWVWSLDDPLDIPSHTNRWYDPYHGRVETKVYRDPIDNGIYNDDYDGTANVLNYESYTLTIPSAPSQVTVSVPDGAADEPVENGVYQIDRTAPTDSPLTVNFSMGGTAERNTDYRLKKDGEVILSSSVDIDAGQWHVDLILEVIDDSIYEPTEIATLTLAPSTEYTIGFPSAGSVTIESDDPLPSISIDDESQAEGDSGRNDLDFTVSLSNPSSQTVTVNYGTADDSAVAPGDYTPVSGTLTFTTGQTSKTVSVPVKGDTTYEPKEEFRVLLSGATNATIADDTGMGTIRNYDAEFRGLWVFNNNCYFDGNDTSANGADDDAMACEKRPLLPGEAATFANYTSYSRGINGVMIDIEGLADTPGLGDFVFRAGNSDAPSGWPMAPAPINDVAADVRQGDGVDGSDRVTIIWADNAIQKQWLQVTALSDANGGTLGLAEDDVFCFGNLPGDTDCDGTVNAFDYVTLKRELGEPAGSEKMADFDLDGHVNRPDFVALRASFGGALAAPIVGSPTVTPVARLDATADGIAQAEQVVSETTDETGLGHGEGVADSLALVANRQPEDVSALAAGPEAATQAEVPFADMAPRAGLPGDPAGVMPVGLAQDVLVPGPRAAGMAIGGEIPQRLPRRHSGRLLEMARRLSGQGHPRGAPVRRASSPRRTRSQRATETPAQAPRQPDALAAPPLALDRLLWRMGRSALRLQVLPG